ncbi:hypothetical protein ScPMuIL_018171 [Solemya velum]
MTMGDNNKALYAKMIIDQVMAPILEKLEKKDISAAQTLRSAFMKADMNLPGFTYDYLYSIMRKAEIHDKFDMCEVLLRLGGTQDASDLRINRPEQIFVELNRRAIYLKEILSRIPDQIYDRKNFLETIKEIANAIRFLLDAVNKVINELPQDTGSKQILEDRKKDFVRNSKKFSNTLKEFFRDTNQNQSVFISADYLIHQTNLILRTMKQECS